MGTTVVQHIDDPKSPRFDPTQQDFVPVETPPAVEPAAPPAEPPKPPEAPAAAPPAPEPVPQATQAEKAPEPPPKMFADKFKTVEDLEKSYKELERGFHAKAQAAAEAERKLKETTAAAEAKTRITPLESAVQQQVAEAVQQPDLAQLLIEKPAEFLSHVSTQAAQTAAAMIQSERVLAEWRRENPDLAERDHLVNAEVRRILEANPERLQEFQDGKGNLSSLLSEATGQIRNWLGTIREAGKQEAMTVRESVASLSATSAAQKTGPTATPEEPAMSPDDILDAEVSAARERYLKLTRARE